MDLDERNENFSEEPEDFTRESEDFTQEGPGLFEDFDAPETNLEASETSPAKSGKSQKSSKNKSDNNPTTDVPDAAESDAIADAMDIAPLALYRRYRPDNFADVIGQEHVTEPLMRALDSNRVNHAYLFSGPRGCGKTTSARILARCLNCETGPTSQPCGECQSCRDLARGGAGSIDVIEIDAASHGNVEEARDLRERAFFSPVRSRYKIYIIDEAHMVTPQGFNALLKVVEEPPAHVKFIFATTEPEKVLGTIRSRTHHYPFRLVPPKTLQDYLAKLCQAEGVALEDGVLPLVVRAGAGSVRDSLSVLDQLLGGASHQGVSYNQATALLGYTPDALLDELITAFANNSGSDVFAGIDRVIEGGQDPRRFAEDLLERFRDLIILKAVPQATETGLISVAPDQAKRLVSQAEKFGPGELTHAAEVIATGLLNMKGTTSPRLALELMCSRILLPGPGAGEAGLHARMERLERRMNTNFSGIPRAGRATDQQTSSNEATPAEPTTPPSPTATKPVPERPAERTTAAERPEARQAARPAAQPAARPAVAERPEARQAPRQAARPAARPTPPTQSRPINSQGENSASMPATTGNSHTPPTASKSIDLAGINESWAEILQRLAKIKRLAWVIVNQYSKPLGVEGNILTLGIANSGSKESFDRNGFAATLTQAIQQATGAQLRVETIVDESSSGAGNRNQRPATSQPRTTETPTPDRESESRTGDNGSPHDAEPTNVVEIAKEENVSLDDEEITSVADFTEELLKNELGAELISEENNV